MKYTQCKFIGIVLAVLLLTLTLFAAVSCNKTGDPSDSSKPDYSETSTDTVRNTDSEHGSETEAPDDSDGMLTLVEGGKAKYTVILPILATDEEKAFAASLKDAFKEATGLNIKVGDDYITANQKHDPDKFEILVGRTNYEESSEVYSEVRYHDYKIKTVGKKLVIAAYTTDKFDAVLSYLKENVLSQFKGSGDNAELSVEFSEKSVSDGNYAVKSWSIAGNSLEKYRFVYENALILDSLKKMRTELAKLTGYYLDIVEDSKTKASDSDFEILIGDTNRTESSNTQKPGYLEYVYKTVGNKLVVKTGGLHSLKKAIENFVNDYAESRESVSIKADYEKTGDWFDDPYENRSMAEGADIRGMSCNVLAEYENYGSTIPVEFRKEIFFAMLDYYQPTIIGVQEFSPAWYAALEEYRDSDKWDIIRVMSPNNKDYYFSTVMYRKDLLTLEESGSFSYSVGNNQRGRCFTWGKFTVKATGVRFAYTSTHLDGFESEDTVIQIGEFAAKVKELERDWGAVISTGDFNTAEPEAWPEAKCYNLLMEQAGMSDFRYNCLEKLNNHSSYHGLGIMIGNDPVSGSLDHIFGTSAASCLKFEVAIFNEQIWASDHSWLMGDIKFN